MEIIWGKGSSFNLGRVGDTGVRVERYNIGTKKDPQWQFLLADEEETYMHVDSRVFKTRDELEEAAIRWLIDAGRLVWVH